MKKVIMSTLQTRKLKHKAVTEQDLTPSGMTLESMFLNHHTGLALI